MSNEFAPLDPVTLAAAATKLRTLPYYDKATQTAHLTDGSVVSQRLVEEMPGYFVNLCKRADRTHPVPRAPHA